MQGLTCQRLPAIILGRTSFLHPGWWAWSLGSATDFDESILDSWVQQTQHREGNGSGCSQLSHSAVSRVNAHQSVYPSLLWSTQVAWLSDPRAIREIMFWHTPMGL